MSLSHLRNPHIAAAAAAEAAAPRPLPSPQDLQVGQRARVRRVACSPADELAARPGAVQAISHEFVALLCHVKGEGTVTRRGIAIKRVELGRGVSCRYWHPDSPLCNNLAADGQKILYALDPHRKEHLHIFDRDGRYLETLPLEETPGFLDQDALAKATAADRRHARRAAAHLSRLHGQDADAARQAAKAQATALQTAVRTLPAADASAPQEPSAQPQPPICRDIAAGTSRLDEDRALARDAVAAMRHRSAQPEPDDFLPNPYAAS